MNVAVRKECIKVLQECKKKYVNVHVIFRNEFKAYIWRFGIYVPSMPLHTIATFSGRTFCPLFSKDLLQKLSQN